VLKCWLKFCRHKKQVLLGLWSRELSHTLLATRHTTTEELLADIMSYERIEKGRKERINGERSFTHSTRSEPIIPQLT